MNALDAARHTIAQITTATSDTEALQLIHKVNSQVRTEHMRVTCGTDRRGGILAAVTDDGRAVVVFPRSGERGGIYDLTELAPA